MVSGAAIPPVRHTIVAAAVLLATALPGCEEPVPLPGSGMGGAPSSGIVRATVGDGLSVAWTPRWTFVRVEHRLVPDAWQSLQALHPLHIGTRRKWMLIGGQQAILDEDHDGFLLGVPTNNPVIWRILEALRRPAPPTGGTP